MLPPAIERLTQSNEPPSALQQLSIEGVIEDCDALLSNLEKVQKLKNALQITLSLQFATFQERFSFTKYSAGYRLSTS